MSLARIARCTAVTMLLVAAAACAAPLDRGAVPATAAAPVPPGEARLWLYRDYEPNESLERPYIRLNGAVIGISEPGGSFYRDLPPGAYAATVDSVGRDVGQFATVAVAAGQTVFVKVEVSKSWESTLTFAADTFYTRLVPPQIAQRELAYTRFTGGE